VANTGVCAATQSEYFATTSPYCGMGRRPRDVHVGHGKIAGAAHRRHDGTAPTARQGLLPRFVKPEDARVVEYLDGSVRVGGTNPSSERIRTWLY
jgi:hypothetical protein